MKLHYALQGSLRATIEIEEPLYGESAYDQDERAIPILATMLKEALFPRQLEELAEHLRITQGEANEDPED